MSFADVALAFRSRRIHLGFHDRDQQRLSTANANAQRRTTPIYPTTLTFGSGSGAEAPTPSRRKRRDSGAAGGGNMITAVVDGPSPTLQGTDIINGGIGP